MRRALLLLAVMAIAGCQNWRFGRAGQPPPTLPTEQEDQRKPDQPTWPPGIDAEPAPGESPDPRGNTEVMAYVDGSPIYMADLHDLLVRADGLRMAQLLVRDKLVQRAAAKRGLTAGDQEIQAEHDLTLQRLFPNVPEAVQRQRLLDELMQRKKIPPEARRIAIRRNVLLGKLLGEDVEVTEEELRRAHESEYGRKVVLRHIQSASLAEAQQALGQLRAGANFADLAAKVSKNASAARGGLLPPVAAKSNLLPRALHKVAWAMSASGEISAPVQAGTSYHILYLERVIDAQDVKLQDVSDQLAAYVRAGKMTKAKIRLLQQMIDQAEIKWASPVLANKAALAPEGSQEDLP